MSGKSHRKQAPSPQTSRSPASGPEGMAQTGAADLQDSAGNAAALQWVHQQQAPAGRGGSKIPLVRGNPLNDLIVEAYDIVNTAFAGMVPRSVMARISSKTGTTLQKGEETVPFVRFDSSNRGENREPTLQEGKGGHLDFVPEGGVTIDEQEGHMTQRGENLYDLAHEFVHLAASGDWIKAIMDLVGDTSEGRWSGASFRKVNESITDWLTRYAFEAAGRGGASTSYNKALTENLVRDVGPMAVARLHFLNDQTGFVAAAKGKYKNVDAAIGAWFGNSAADQDLSMTRMREAKDRYAEKAGVFQVGTNGAALCRGGDYKPTRERIPRGTEVEVTRLSADDRFGFVQRPAEHAGWTAMANLVRR